MRASKVWAVAIVVAAGRGTRLGGRLDKPYVRLAGKPLVWHSLHVMQQCPLVRDVVLVVHRLHVRSARRWLRRCAFSKIRAVVAGGATRQDSVFAGLQAMAVDTPVAVVHDAARPFISGAMLLATIRHASKGTGAVVGMPVQATIKKIGDGQWVDETPDRSALREIQTPQAFPAPLLVKAHRAAQRNHWTGTDDAALLERMGAKVKVLDGDVRNFKITTPQDLMLAKLLMRDR